MKNIFTLALLLFIFSCDLEEVPDNIIPTTFEQNYGFEYRDGGYSVIQTNDDRYAIVGITDIDGNQTDEIYLILTDENGEKVDEKIFGVDIDIRGSRIIQTQDGGFAILGFRRTIDSTFNRIALFLTDENGENVTEVKFSGYEYDVATSIIQKTNGDFAITGYTSNGGTTSSDFYLLLVDANGNVISEHSYGTPFNDYAHDIIETQDGGLALVGKTDVDGNGYDDVLLILTDRDGNELSTSGKSFGGGSQEDGRSIVQTPDGNFAIVGMSASSGNGSITSYLILTDKNGNELPESGKYYGNDATDQLESIAVGEDGTLAMLGSITADNLKKDMYLIITDKGGNIIEEKNIGKSEGEWGSSIIRTKDGGYALVGNTMSFGTGDLDVYFVKTDANGNL